MPQNQEIIEAKLCAYIDDELDAAGRAEIEKHLTANPQHRRLIEELRRTSALVHNLPHESAPPELAEAFNSQLERSVLLEGVSEAVEGADLKMPRWPQIVAMAAITLLTVGLAVVIYFALPGIGNRPQLVQATIRPAAPGASSATDEARLPAELAKSPELQKQLETDKSAAVADATPQEPVAAAAAPAAAPAPTPSPLAYAGAAPVDRDRLALRRNASPPGSSDRKEISPIVLVVHTNDPGQARKALVTYLVKQDVAWEPAVAPAEVDSLKRSGPTTHPTGEPAQNLDDLAANGVREASPELQSAQTAVAAKASGQVEQAQANAKGAASGALPSVPATPTDFSVSCRMTVEQVEALRTAITDAGASMDALPPDKQYELVLTSKDERGAVQNEEPARGGRIAAAESPATAPTTAPADLPQPEFGLGRAEPTTQPSSDSDGTAANLFRASPTTPSTAPAAPSGEPMQLLIVVRAAEASATQPATPTAPTTEPVDSVAPTTQE